MIPSSLLELGLSLSGNAGAAILPTNHDYLGSKPILLTCGWWLTGRPLESFATTIQNKAAKNLKERQYSMLDQYAL